MDNFSKGVIVNLTPGVYSVKVVFDTNAYHYSMENDIEVNKYASIKPSRDRLTNYEVLLSNIKLYEN